MTLSITLTDQIPSGKNVIKERFVHGKKIRYPNARFETWRRTAGYEIVKQRAAWLLAVKGILPLKGDLSLTVSYRELVPVPANGDRDITGMTDALQHLLEYMEIIEDDGQIHGLVWQYPWRTEGPCVEMEIQQV